MKAAFGGVLSTSTNPGANLAQTLLSEVAGKVVAVFDGEFTQYYDGRTGIFPYRDLPALGFGLRVYDQYSNTDSLPTMSADQQNKLQAYGGYGNDYLFLLSWTLTGAAGLLDVQVLSTLANPWLPQITDAIDRGSLNDANIIFYDFVDPYFNRAIIHLNRCGIHSPRLASF